ncbi:hypothetical protein 1 [Beihai picorna-like virus 85]|uniref:hypothetical protein 1 n=1 Tax=Beihai picorna-like virus 85 TaxID=1922633 RepID=UPI00090AEAD2|nr:hypothetical protein 1 [Beihai picorna-like virus 85]APG76754.1 hypothetical protein 1 [Beihai picorna-like virus 85]
MPICDEWENIVEFAKFVGTDFVPYRIDVPDNCPISGLCCYLTTEDIDFEFGPVTVVVTGSASRFRQEYATGLECALYKAYHQDQLMLSGDVETNPGPDTTRPPLSQEQMSAHIREQNKQMRQMDRRYRQLQKEIARRDRRLQRALEEEKKQRNRNRKDLAHDKRSAQGLVDVIDSDLKASIQTTLDSVKTASSIVSATLPSEVVPTLQSVKFSADTLTRATTEKLGPTLDMLSQMLDSLNTNVEVINEAFGAVKDISLVDVIISFIGVCNAIINKQLLMMTIHAGNLARHLGVGLSSLTGLIPSFSESNDMVTFEEELDPTNPFRTGQSLVTDLFSTAATHTEFLPIVSILTFLSGVFNLACTGTVPAPTHMLKHFANVGRAANGFKAVRDMFTWLYTYLAEIYYTTVYGLTRDEFDLIKTYPKLEQLWAASKIVRELPKKTIDSSGDIANQILDIVSELQDYLYQATRVNSRINTSLISTILKTIKDQSDWAKRSPARANTVRKEPIGVYLYGQPGVGKSVLTQVLTASFYRDYLKDTGVSFKDCCFPRKAINEHWDGYFGQPIVELDDLGNIKDSIVKPDTTYEEIQYMVNTAPYPLRMAELSQKGVTNFTSDLVLATANEPKPDIVHMQNPGAIYRRFKIYAEVSIDPNYGEPSGIDEHGNTYYKFDEERTAQYLNTPVEQLDPLFVGHYRFHIYTVEWNKKERNATVRWSRHAGIDFDQFYAIFRKTFDAHSTKAARIAAAIRKIAGIDEDEDVDTHAETLESIKRIFNEDKFQHVIAASEVDLSSVLGEIFTDAKQHTNELFGALTDFTSYRDRLDRLKAKFDVWRGECRGMMTDFYSRLAKVPAFLSEKLHTFMKFILGSLGYLATKTIVYFPAITMPRVLLGAISLLSAALGAWWSGMFPAALYGSRRSWCKFAKNDGDSALPCCECPPCKIIDYPSSGDLLEHFLQRTAVKQVRADLVAIGVSDNDLTMRINSLWIRKEKKTREKTVDEILDIIKRSETFGEGVYTTDPRAPQRHQIAQRMYDTQPRAQPTRTYAQGIVECKLPMHLDATRFAQGDSISVSETIQTVLQNLVWLEFYTDVHTKVRCNGLFLVGRTLATVAHVALDPNVTYVKVSITNPWCPEPTCIVPFKELKTSQMKHLDGRPLDVALLSFPPVVPSRPKITHKFIAAEDLPFVNNGEMAFGGFHLHKDQLIVHEKHPGYFRTSEKITEYFAHTPGKCPKSRDHCICPLRIANNVEYDLETFSGMCGSLLTLRNKRIKGKLLGIHVAGGPGVLALGAILTRELVQAQLTDHVDKHNIPVTYLIDGRIPQGAVNASVLTSFPEKGDCLNIGIAPPPTASSKTRLNPSCVFDELQPHFTKPAHLKPVLIDGVLVNPMEKGVQKLLGTQKWIEPDLLEAAVNDVFQGFKVQPERGIVHTYEEAITGIEGDPFKRPINRSTSAGYPYNLQTKKKGKTEWLGEDEYILDHPQLRADVEKLIQDSRNGIRGSAISMATLKDEKRPFAKVDAGKTRVFEACPQHLVIAIRMYFLDFSAMIMEQRISNGIAVGINPYSLEWTKLANKLLEKGNMMIAGDFSNFDGSLLMQVLQEILKHINAWYDDGPENALIRACLWEHICNADVIIGNQIIRQTHSQPSGNPLTVIVNSLFNLTIMRVAYLQLKIEQGLPPVCDYTDYVSEIAYGDDDIKSVHPSIIHWFNQLTITDALSRLGLTYTDETKGEVVQPYKTLEEITFLKRYFAMQPDGLYMAPMAIENILEMTNWVRGNDIVPSTVENCKFALQELSLHDKKTYDLHANRIRAKLAPYTTFKLPTWFEQRAHLTHIADLFEIGEYVSPSHSMI